MHPTVEKKNWNRKKVRNICEIQAVSTKRFANMRFSQLSDERCWHVRERSPSKSCNLPDSETLYFVGKSAKRAVTSGWRALTDVPSSLVIQLRKPPVNKPPVGRSLRDPPTPGRAPKTKKNTPKNPFFVVFGIFFALSGPDQTRVVLSSMPGPQDHRSREY